MTTGDFKSQFGEAFGLTFGLVFATTLFVFPLVLLMGGTQSDTFPSGSYRFSVWFGLIFFAVPILLKSALVAPITFAIIMFALRKFLPIGCAFVISAAGSAFASSYCGIMIDIDLFPPGLTWREMLHSFAVALGATAASITILVATPVWFVTRANSESPKHAR